MSKKVDKKSDSLVDKLISNLDSNKADVSSFDAEKLKRDQDFAASNKSGSGDSLPASVKDKLDKISKKSS